jgi:glycosyltransferase involved in cell wall biosynthesis
MHLPKVLVLYSELAEYSIACFGQLKASGSTLMIVHWPINSEAPFWFDLSFLDEVYSRETLGAKELLNAVNCFAPDLIISSGWMDRGYVKVCKEWRNKIPVVLSMDNHWEGSFKQQIARLVAPFTIRKTFNRAFVPGEVQYQYALKLGFKSDQIETGFYSADTNKFDSFYQIGFDSKKKAFPKRFLYLGRYTEHKGIFDLWSAFLKFKEKHPDWELWCVGTGDQFENRVEVDGIRHFGFVQPSELEPLLSETGVYILPSHFEPWGVSVHEMAVAGFPMILSDKIGSREAFLKEDENGKVFRSGDVDGLLDAMLWIGSQTESKLNQMGSKSHELGMKNTPQIWAEKLLSMIDHKS